MAKHGLRTGGCRHGEPHGREKQSGGLRLKTPGSVPPGIKIQAPPRGRQRRERREDPRPMLRQGSADMLQQQAEFKQRQQQERRRAPRGPARLIPALPGADRCVQPRAHAAETDPVAVFQQGLALDFPVPDEGLASAQIAEHPCSSVFPPEQGVRSAHRGIVQHRVRRG